MDSSDKIAIVAIIVSGVVGPSIVALWAWRARRAEEKRVVRENQLVVLETAINNLSRARHAVALGFSAWKAGLPFADVRAQEIERSVGDALNALWVSEDQVRIRFGHDASVTSAYEQLVAAFDRLRQVYHRYSEGRPISPADQEAWRETQNALVRAQRFYVDKTREATGLAPRGRLRIRRGSGR